MPETSETSHPQPFNIDGIVWIQDPVLSKELRSTTKKAIQCFLDVGAIPENIRTIPGLAMNLPTAYNFGGFRVYYSHGDVYNPIGTHLLRVPEIPEELLEQVEKARQLQELDIYFKEQDIHNNNDPAHSI